MKKLLGTLLAAFILAGCGYKPTISYTKKVFTDDIYAKVIVSRVDPQNSVLVQDALNEAVISRFGAKLTEEESARSKITVRFKSINFKVLEYDDDGYATYYQAVVNLNVDYETPTQSDRFNVSGSYEFPVEASSVITDAKRYEALKNGSLKALDAFISKAALKGISHDDPEHNQK